MRTRAWLVLAVVTALVVGIAAYTVMQRDTGGGGRGQETVLFPDLMARINDVAALAFTKGGETWSVTREAGGGWVMPAKGGYPASADMVKKAVVAFADLKMVEAKTAKPELYGRIGVRDVGEEGSEAVLVALWDGSGEELAALLVGKTKTSGGATLPSEVYVRKPGEARAWLVRAHLDIEDNPVAWLDSTMPKVPKARVQRVVTHHPDGEVLTIARRADNDNLFAPVDPPIGFVLKSANRVNTMASALEFLSFEDVRPAGEADETGKATVSEFETDDGLRVTVRLFKEGEDRWLRLSAAFDDALAKPDSDADAVRKEAEEINRRTGGWAYRIPGYRVADYETRLDDLKK